VCVVLRETFSFANETRSLVQHKTAPYWTLGDKFMAARLAILEEKRFFFQFK